MLQYHMLQDEMYHVGSVLSLKYITITIVVSANKQPISERKVNLIYSERE